MTIFELKELIRDLPDEMTIALEMPGFWSNQVDKENCRVVSYGKNSVVKLFEIKHEGSH
jgi:hypothetical protein